MDPLTTANKASNRSLQPLEDELEVLRSTLYHLTAGVIVADRDGKFLICNQLAKNVLAPAAREDSPHSWSDVQGCFKPDGMTPYPADELPSTLALAGKKVPETEIYIRNEQCPLGIWVAVQAKPLQNGSGDIRGSVVVFHDITQKKETETLVRKR